MIESATQIVGQPGAGDAGVSRFETVQHGGFRFPLAGPLPDLPSEGVDDMNVARAGSQNEDFVSEALEFQVLSRMKDRGRRRGVEGTWKWKFVGVGSATGEWSQATKQQSTQSRDWQARHGGLEREKGSARPSPLPRRRLDSDYPPDQALGSRGRIQADGVVAAGQEVTSPVSSDQTMHDDSSRGSVQGNNIARTQPARADRLQQDAPTRRQDREHAGSRDTR